MADGKVSLFAFQDGIEAIIEPGRDAAALQAWRNDSLDFDVAAEVPPVGAVGADFGSRTFDEAVIAAIAPRSSELSELSPQAYRDELSQAADVLSRASLDQPEAAAVFAQAEAVLREEGALWNLLTFYRSLLRRA